MSYENIESKSKTQNSNNQPSHPNNATHPWTDFEEHLRLWSVFASTSMGRLRRVWAECVGGWAVGRAAGAWPTSSPPTVGHDGPRAARSGPLQDEDGRESTTPDRPIVVTLMFMCVVVVCGWMLCGLMWVSVYEFSFWF